MGICPQMIFFYLSICYCNKREGCSHNIYKTEESSMIHSASPQSAVIFAWFWSFGQKDVRTGGRTTCVKIVISTGRPGLWLASWINNIYGMVWTLQTAVISKYSLCHLLQVCSKEQEGERKNKERIKQKMIEEDFGNSLLGRLRSKVRKVRKIRMYLLCCSNYNETYPVIEYASTVTYTLFYSYSLHSVIINNVSFF